MLEIRLDELISTIERAHPQKADDQLVAAVIESGNLADVADHLVGHFVDVARRSGLSWAEVGECLGVTRQAAQKRFVIRDELTLLTAFTAKARQSVLQAEREAAALGHATVEPGHLLLGLVDVPNCLAALELLSVLDGSQVREVAASALRGVETRDGATSSPPLSEAATNVLESAADMAARLHHGYVGTEHILLALLDSATPGRLARKLRLDVAETEQRLVKAANAAATRQP
jgi:hypothetical protein